MSYEGITGTGLPFRKFPAGMKSQSVQYTAISDNDKDRSLNKAATAFNIKAAAALFKR